MSVGSTLDGRWYAPLVRPVLPTVRSALVEVEAPDDAWAIPRTGLGGAVVIHVARSFGRRRWRRAGRVAVAALEGYNQRVHREQPSAEERARWLARDFRWVHRVWTSVLENEAPIVSRVMDRLLGDEDGFGDSPMPEAVLFLRSAVAAGVVAGAVDDAIHEALDRHATWLGLAWEAQRGELSPAGWHGALRAVKMGADFPGDPDRFAREQARDALRELPESSLIPLLEAILEAVPSEPDGRRNPDAWRPQLAPAPEARPVGLAEATPLGRFSARWCPAIDRALAEAVASRSRALGAATHYLLGQGGKRARPLMTLAAAEACGGDPREALPAAAAIEWIHQGSLVLDDIIDEAPLRRGAPPLHERTSPAFAAGVATFILARVHRALDVTDPEIRRRLVDAGSTLVTGEQLELRHTGDGQLSVTDYYRVIEAKTARIFAAAAGCGALAAGADRRAVKALTSFGREVGLAFQIVDDLLDYTGGEARLGKRPGTDLRAAKMTLPLILLRDSLDGPGRAWLASALGRGEVLDELRGELFRHHVPEACQARAEQHLARAARALVALDEGPGREVLWALAERMVERDR